MEYIGEWCENQAKNGNCEFDLYSEDGQCNCGVFKHHVHCKHGYVIQVG